MKLCTLDDFENNKWTQNDTYNNERLKRRLCVDEEKLKDQLFIKNSYSNNKERTSFSVVATVCKNSTVCASKEDIDELLEKIYFTFYIVEEMVEFGNDITLDPI